MFSKSFCFLFLKTCFWEYKVYEAGPQAPQALGPSLAIHYMTLSPFGPLAQIQKPQGLIWAQDKTALSRISKASLSRSSLTWVGVSLLGDTLYLATQ